MKIDNKFQPISTGSRLFNEGPIKIGSYGLYPMASQSIKIEPSEHALIQTFGGQAAGGLLTNQEPILRA